MQYDAPRNRCVTGQELQAQACRDQGGVVTSDGKCAENQAQANAYNCQLAAGKVYVDGRCVSEEDANKIACQAQGMLYVASQGCFKAEDVATICENAGFIWADGKCYVLANNQVPKGLETFYRVVQTAQEKALVGAYRTAVDKLINQKGQEKQAALDAQASQLQTQLDAEVTKLTASYQQQIDDVSGSYEAKLAQQQQLTAEYEAEAGRLTAISLFMADRFEDAKYFSGPASTDAFGAIKNIAGAVGNSPRVEVVFPDGFPTPTRAANGGWAVNVPVKVVFPQVHYEGVNVGFEGKLIQYGLSADGGQTFTPGELPTSFESHGEATSTTFYVRGTLPEANSNYKLVVVVGITFDQIFDFGEGNVYAVQGFRESQPLERTFYTTSNPLESSPATPSSVAASESCDDCGSGESAGGIAGAYNWAAAVQAQAQAAANAIDAKSGLGLGLLVEYWPWAAGVGAVGVAFAVGGLNWIPAVKTLRLKFGKKPKDELGLGDDLLGGI